MKAIIIVDTKTFEDALPDLKAGKVIYISPSEAKRIFEAEGLLQVISVIPESSPLTDTAAVVLNVRRTIAQVVQAGTATPTKVQQGYPSLAKNEPLHAFKPGDLFAIVIKKITGANPCPNKCRERITQMNQWGWLKCWRERKTIVTWLAEEARRRGHTISEAQVMGLLKAAWKEVRKPNK